MSIFDKIQKRACYPFTLVNGETVHIRSLTIHQLTVIEPFKYDMEANGYALGCCLVDDEGKRVFDQGSMAAKDFGRHVLEQLDLPLDVFHPLVEQIMKVSNAPSAHAAEAITKN